MQQQQQQRKHLENDKRNSILQKQQQRPHVVRNNMTITLQTMIYFQMTNKSQQ